MKDIDLMEKYELKEYVKQLETKNKRLRDEKREILNELQNIEDYMGKRNAIDGYGQISDLIKKHNLMIY